MNPPRIDVPKEAIKAFCRKWQVTEFAFFGSVVRDDFGPDSDVDVLVSFHPSARHTLFDLVHMEDELREIFGRDVDLVTRPAVERNPNEWRRDAILGSLSHVAVAS
jgi:predicted nucleotidyltransferase